MRVVASCWRFICGRFICGFERERVDERWVGGSRCLLLCFSLRKSDKEWKLHVYPLNGDANYVRLWIPTLVNRRGGVYVIDKGALHVPKGGVRLLASLFL